MIEREARRADRRKMLRALAIVAGAVLVMALAPRARAETISYGGVETFAPAGLRLVPVGGAPGASLCTSATDGRIAYDGGLVYLCDAGTWVSLGPTAALSTTTAASFTINSDADGTATEDAALRLKAQSLGLGIAADAVLTSAIGASPPGIAVYYDTPVDQYLYLGPPGDALSTGNLEAGIRFRSHTSGDAVGTVKEGLVRHSSAGVLVLDGFASVQVADDLDIQGNTTTTGTFDGRDVSADGTALDGVVAGLSDHLADAVDAHDASAVSVADAGGLITATDVEGALAEHAALIIPDTLATASGQYLRATGSGTWGVRTTGETQTDLDVLTTTAAALATGAAAIGADPTGLTYATGATLQAMAGQLDGQLVTATAAAATAQSAAGVADALAESVATDRVCFARPGPYFDGTNNDISWALDQYNAADREVYAVGTDGTGAQDAALVQQACVPQRDPALSAARVTYKVTGTMQVVLTVVGSDGTVCATSAAGTSTTKAALSAGDTSACVTTAGEPVDLRATCSGGAAADTCSIGHFDVQWAR